MRQILILFGGLIAFDIGAWTYGESSEDTIFCRQNLADLIHSSGWKFHVELLKLVELIKRSI